MSINFDHLHKKEVLTNVKWSELLFYILMRF